MHWGVDVYFADAHSPGSAARTSTAGNRQLRYWLPKGTDLRRHAQSDLDAICNVLNTQPRKSLDWKAPTRSTLTMPRASSWDSPTYPAALCPFARTSLRTFT